MQYLESESFGVIVKSDWARHDITLSVAMALDWLWSVALWGGGGYVTAREGIGSQFMKKVFNH